MAREAERISREIVKRTKDIFLCCLTHFKINGEKENISHLHFVARKRKCDTRSAPKNGFEINKRILAPSHEIKFSRKKIKRGFLSTKVMMQLGENLEKRKPGKKVSQLNSMLKLSRSMREILR